ncbi:MAG: efflux RND transporter periplasmic adaptor subunit [Candidatus Paceibacterota bacterium]|jgi:multidrug resistance efflux pump
MNKLFTKKFLIYFAVAVVAVVALFFIFKNGNGKQTIAVVRANLVQEVASTGKIKPSQSINLGFDKSGRVQNVYVSIGQNVEKNQLLASLEAGEISADLIKAQATLSEENIKLREIKNTAPTTFNDASKNLEAAIKESFASADNAVRNKADQFFKNNTINPQFEISITSGNFVHYFNVPSDTVLEINNDRKKAEEILVAWQKALNNLNSGNLEVTADKAIKDLNFVSNFLDKIAGAVNAFTSADYAYDTTVSGYKTTISGARNEVLSAVSSLVTAKDKLNLAPILGSDGQFGTVLTQESKVSQAQANISSLEASLNKFYIKAPFAGVVILQDAKVGGAVSAGVTLISIVSQNSMYIEANISEIHIGKIAVGNQVSVTFDAFPDEEFQGFVSYIEPGDVIIDGVVNYKIRVELGETMIGDNGQVIMKFANPDPKIKSGLTANLKIKTAQKPNVLAIPLYTVIKENELNFVNKIVNGKVEKTQIELGLSGNTGLVEVLSGLQEGDAVGF